MNSVDLALALVLAVATARGYWRGFFRECFGVLALIGGIAAAVQCTGLGAALLQEHLRLPASLQVGITFVVIFALVHSLVNLIGAGLDRLTASGLLRPTSRIVGAAFGAGKAAAVLAFVLLFLHLFPLAPRLDGPIMSSKIGRPLVGAASDVVRRGLQAAAQPDARHTT
ncbi:MAG: CvpA family protein [Candidatus Binatia bacterium]